MPHIFLAKLGVPIHSHILYVSKSSTMIKALGKKIWYWFLLEIPKTLVEETDINQYFVICVFQMEEASKCLGVDKEGFAE